MRTFQLYIRRYLLILTVISLVLVVAFAAFLLFSRINRSGSSDLRSQLTTINSLIRAVHDHTRIGSEETLKNLDESVLRAGNRLPSGSLPDGTDRVLRRLHADPDEAVMREAVEIFGSVARELSGRYYRRESRNNRIIIGFALGMSLLLAGMIALSFRISGRQREYINRTSTLLNQVKSVLNYESDGIAFLPRWQEETELLEIASSIADGHRTNRELIEHPIYGTLEAFIPRLQGILERFLPCDRLAVAFIDNSGNVIAESAATHLPSIRLEPGFIAPLAETSLGQVIDSRRYRILNDLPRHYAEVNQSLATGLIMEEGIKSSLTLPIELHGKVFGFLFISSVRLDAYTAEDARRAEKILSLLKQNLLYHYVIQEVIGETTRAFVALMERKDNETSLHITRMSQYSWAVARELAATEEQLTPMKLREIRWFAPLHDIGKVGIPDAILQKPGGLDTDERAVIEQHVTIGIDVIHSMNLGINRILPLDILSTAEEIIAGHHEWYDGNGYPRGLAGDAIPLAGRIVAVADVFDALTSVRPYKDAYSIERALGIMEEGVGTHFDPRVYRGLLDAMPEIRRIYERYKEI